ncbi:VWA domain-containing protein [Deinococcus sp. HMF7604]|uniref:vWA domain-containing protein n=1 Tax=Deinococcus betulae TaxID=2873312 RepID=UPI001CCCC37A|nr:VWA domain-containing protein [Deinococcus betulae]MBZ9749407.1 VWA domain-containing protein [Deinococcus betulae]
MPKSVVSAALLTLFLAACQRGTPTPAVPLPATPTVPAATTGTVNGVRIVDASTYQVGFTPLSDKDIVANGQLKAVTVRSLSAGTATASVCGQVQVQDAITVTINLDSTGSMVDNDPGKLRRAADQAFVTRMTAQDRAAVLSFETYTSASTGLLASRLWQDFSADKPLLNAAIAKATFEGGSTQVYDAIVDASKLAPMGTALILTDGEDNSSRNSAQKAIDEAKKNGTKVFVIGLDARNTLNFRALEDITAATGGLFQKTGSAADLQCFFDRMYNAFRAQGCVQLSFTQKPAAGTAVTGTLSVTVGAPDRRDAQVDVPFTLTVR